MAEPKQTVTGQGIAPGACIVAILDCIYSERDSSGNVYWAFNFTDVATGKTVSAIHTGGESNLRAIELFWNGDRWPNREKEAHFYVGVRSMPKREFNRYTKDLPYGGCTPEQLWKFIKEEMTKLGVDHPAAR